MSLAYSLAYRTGITPWERAGAVGASQLAALVTSVEGDLGRRGSALDLGCGTGAHAVAMAERGWTVTGIDLVELAVRRAQQRADERGAQVRFVRGDVTDLDPLRVGTGYDLLVDVGCFHGFDDEGRRRFGESASRVAAPDAAAIILAFAPGRRPGPRGADAAAIERALPGWRIVQAQAASAEGLPSAMRKAAPTWFRLRRTA